MLTTPLCGQIPKVPFYWGLLKTLVMNNSRSKRGLIKVFALLKFQASVSNATKLWARLKMLWSIAKRRSMPAPLWLKKKTVTSQSFDCVTSMPGTRGKSARHHPGVTARWPRVSVWLMAATKDNKMRKIYLKTNDLIRDHSLLYLRGKHNRSVNLR